LYNAAGILASTGRIFEWFRDISGQQGKDYREMMGEIVGLGHERSIPFFFPSFHTGEVWEFSNAVFAGLDPEHRAPEMGRAVVESIGFGVRDLIETLERNGCRIEELRACGGQARNEIWNQMKADITGKAVVVPEVVDAELIGDACAGLVGLRDFSSLAEASEELVRLQQTFEPSLEEHRRFTDEYLVYEDMCRRVVGIARASGRAGDSLSK
jgi:xylulokinase